ncbi:MAG: hypothetical protein O8C64_04245 [Candidatus Methanoperedens sp.]|nr:hypothetical protein [Candidatus Methanoperedens sp.]MCZ7403732.1 hypothetical protein [Candidatus Methanoperedens sp.]
MTWDATFEFIKEVIGSENLKSTGLALFVFYLLLNVREKLINHDNEIKRLNEKIIEIKNQLSTLETDQKELSTQKKRGKN